MTDVSNAAVSKKHKGHWSQGLLSSIADPNLIVEEDELTVTIKDKYPKVYNMDSACGRWAIYRKWGKISRVIIYKVVASRFRKKVTA